MNPRVANIVRLDNIDGNEFVKTVEESTGKQGVYLPDRKVFDVCINFNDKDDSAGSESANAFNYQLYMVLEDELLHKTRDRYFAFVTDKNREDILRDLAFQVRDELTKNNITSYFRIDPLHGLVIGSTKNTISPYFGDPCPKVCIVLYLVTDINHPGVAMYEYVDRKYRKKFIDTFKEINGSLPKRLPKFLDTNVFLLGRKKESYILKHTDIVHIIQYLGTRDFTDITVDLMYQNLSQHELDNLAFDTVAASFLFQGQGKFFHTLDDLLMEKQNS